MENAISRILTLSDRVPFRRVLKILWANPRRRIATTAGLVATYLVLVACLRFQRLRRLHRQYRQYSTRQGMAYMTDHDAWAIQKQVLQLEFPTISLKALQFALFRTYGIPTISKLLLKTSQFSDPATSFKRYADTGALIGQFMSFEPTSDRALTAIARTKFLHTGYRTSGSILNSDMLYTLSLFATEPIRFVEMFEWRSMSDLERCAIGTYWKNLGDALEIDFTELPSATTGFRDGLHFLEEMTEWSHRYEEQYMKPSPENKAVADKTMDVLVYALPAGLKGVGVSFASCMMDERLRVAMMYDAPARLYYAIFFSLVAIRRFYLRYLSLPRPRFLRLDVFSDGSNEHGRHYVSTWSGAPYYVKPTLSNRWGLSAWFMRLLGLPLPGDEGEKYYPKGFDTAELGPKYFEGKGRKTEANVPPEKIHILEKLAVAGGGTISEGDPVNGYNYRAGGMPSFNGSAMEELLSVVPSRTRKGKTALDDIVEFESHALNGTSHTRLLTRRSHGLGRIDPRKINLGLRDRIELFVMVSKNEKALARTRIKDHFSGGFFKSNYWLMLATTFGFQPWHSATELRRYMARFMHDIHDLNSPRVLDCGRYNRHETIVAPIAHFLTSQGVDFQFNTTVSDIILDTKNENRVSAICAQKDGEREHKIVLGQNDIVIVSVGSVMSGTTVGSNTEPPSLELMEIDKDLDENWLLWLELSTKNPKFGNAYNFCTRMPESRLESFTVTLKDPEFFNRFCKLTDNQPGTAAFVTLKDSSWIISLNIPQQPLFPDQPGDVQVLWGYALCPEAEGNYVKKPMLACSGEEIMTEILQHLQFPVDGILKNSITIPSVVPRMTATLLPRADGDRPQVIPEGMENLALIGQFVDIPDEVVVSMDYGVRGAQMAVRRLMGLDNEGKKSKRSSAISLLM
ncbi:67 kDa myosin-cross-reactive antigen family protein [Aspergillus pseudonomiae]|uniref:67 kDa myosin-cross-reactive antigen family protein n=1 Tax=Aspergillus pseudonomiae TaxID=1506151 RepID=A0A5N7DG34_9EURO|nr:67 kDa myosin-cross-reactive antigen family protein [Aspergillus pseudonomiae]KAE8404993.1 67 kDa myosin-cross-reactive antigen family protein [Aspergillus pseudonomiae]